MEGGGDMLTKIIQKYFKYFKYFKYDKKYVTFKEFVMYSNIQPDHN